MMQAITYNRYGTADELRLKEVQTPVPKDHEVLVKVHAASVNSWDWDMVRGKPYFVRMWGLFKPRFKIPGADIAGRVVSIGPRVKRFKPGDEVFGDLAESGFSAFAEYATASEQSITLKPATMSFEQAAALPQAGALAIQTLCYKTRIKAGDRILIVGAGGGVGTLGIQIAKANGVEVTVVDKGTKLDRLRALGADHAIDYLQNDFTKGNERYDLIMDVVANRSLATYKRVLAPGGRFLMVGGTTSSILEAMFLGRLISTKEKKVGIMAYTANQGMDELIALFNEGKMVPVIDRIFALSETADAFRYFAEGDFVGKIVIQVA